ncbi:MAG: hypothetical protein M3388_06120 [Acidobacteriota bacterium]|nr:hypothetical protein [Acidobacteriota bacterium]
MYFRGYTYVKIKPLIVDYLPFLVFLLVADLLAELELFDFEAELPVFDEPPLAFGELANAFAPAPMAPVTAPPAAPVIIPLATSFKTFPASATKP